MFTKSLILWVVTGDPTRSHWPTPTPFTYLLYVISPVAVPPTMIEANSSESELRVTAPVPAIFVKSPTVVRDPVFSIVNWLVALALTVLYA